ncbi:MAG TPA: 6-carboxytetrahydropterin synthase [Bryobacteraceae bacterium]|nr:6-carboxytetrahydropterin synthase [Bryobacteraceae bacterium]
MRLTRRYRFCASHRLHSGALSEAENRALYGKCNNPFGHGHDYVLEVSIRGPLDPATGQLAPVGVLDRLVNDAVIAPMDHRNLNLEVPAFAAAVPTSENLAGEIERRLREAWPPAFSDSSVALAGIRLRETKRNSFETAS